MKMKHKEFLALKQGAMTVTEYRDHFLQLARYAPAEVANDGDKQEHFREGLDDHLEYSLMNHRFDNFNHLVDSASIPAPTAAAAEATSTVPAAIAVVPALSSDTLQHAQLHRLHQLRGRECLLLLPDSRLQHSHGRAITAASRDTTPTLVPGRRSLDSRGAQLSPRRHPRAG
jgi:hypothetical protein